MDGERDPSAVLHDGPRARITETAGGAELRPPLRHTAAGEVDLGQRADELYITVGGYTRSLVLPAGLCERQVTSARVDGARLSVRFTPREPDTTAVRATDA